MASGRNGTLYIGVTSDLWNRVYQQKRGEAEGFTKTYGCKQLVWYQSFELMTSAIRREKTMKGWPRAWKLNLIEAENPDWRDLADDMFDPQL
jgi:putative endonuclease